VHYEFLDNSVALGEQPRTVAFGWNGEMQVLDVGGLLDVERYHRINVEAHAPAEVYPGARDMAPECNTRFLAACLNRLPVVNFADRKSGRIWLRCEDGRPVWADAEGLAQALKNPETRAGIATVMPEALQRGALPAAPAGRPALGAEQSIHTLGEWGAAPANA
jgi:hypothetical protein